jgi:hypothetical protein
MSDIKKFQQMVMTRTPSPCYLTHTVENVILNCISYNKARFNRSLKVVQTLVKLTHFAKNNNNPLVLTNESVIRQLQDAIVRRLSDMWCRSNVAGETRINYLKYDKGKRKVYRIDADSIVTHITEGVDFNALYPSTYSSIHNEMIWYTGNKMLMSDNFKEYTTEKEQIIWLLVRRRSCLW